MVACQADCAQRADRFRLSIWLSIRCIKNLLMGQTQIFPGLVIARANVTWASSRTMRVRERGEMQTVRTAFAPAPMLPGVRM